MPIANFTCVREVSSADKVHKAENLLKQEYGKSWRTAKAGERSACVILELAKPQQIIGIDIGNEHSAFVQVQVGRSFDNFTDILLTCSFMTPTESKSSNQCNRVRCFHREALVQSALEEKWSLVKVICTQPFNMHVPYGLSFIKVHTVESGDSDKQQQQQQQSKQKLSESSSGPAVGENIASKLPIKLREESPESESESTSTLFKRWKMSRHSEAAAAQASQDSIAQKPEVLDRNRDSLLFGDDDDDEVSANSAKLKRLEMHIEQERQRQRSEAEQRSKPKRTSIDKGPDSSVASKTSNASPHLEKERKRRSALSPLTSAMSAKKQKQEKTPEIAQPKRKYRPLHQLLEGVVLVISGIQNPDRADLRNKAMALGAKYKADWSPGCTHLICAFKNTPKYNQVKGKGKIVTKSWIEQCYKLKKYLPWRRYALDNSQQGSPESDEEIWDVSLQPAGNQSDIEPSSTKSTRVNDTLALYDQNNDNVRNVDADSDTDDEIQRVITKGNAQIRTKGNKDQPDEEFNADTEEEDYLQSKLRGLA